MIYVRRNGREGVTGNLHRLRSRVEPGEGVGHDEPQCEDALAKMRASYVSNDEVIVAPQLAREGLAAHHPCISPAA
jgi:hypothetical protein